MVVFSYILYINYFWVRRREYLFCVILFVRIEIVGGIWVL